MSKEDYRSALRLGQREYRACVARGEYPYLQALDEILSQERPQGETPLGLVDIPLDRVVGTRSAGRQATFARNFMPLLGENSEFAAKWTALCEAHLAEGIREPIRAYEYMNRFYVSEGNKRVSVLKFFGAVTVPGNVIRVMPAARDTDESRVYFEFLDFYRLTRVNGIWFSRPGRFQTLLGAVGGGDDPWTDRRRAAFTAAYARFRRVFKALGGDRLPGTTGDAFLCYVKLYGLDRLAQAEEGAIRADLTRSWRELAAYVSPEPVELDLTPDGEGRGRRSKLLSPRPEALRTLFLYEKSPETSGWTHAHEEGRRWAEEALGGRAETRFRADVDPEEGLEAIREGVAQGARVVFTTSPKLLPACVKAAVECPEVKLLNCSVYSPHPSIRTYYGRMFEVKFLSGVIAGAMSHTHQVGYVADYPILGTIAAINAFALGAAMADPWATVHLAWRCTGEANVWDDLVARGVDMLSGQDLRSPVDPWRAVGLYHVKDGAGRQVAWAGWNWGRFYQRLLELILNGQWRETGREDPRAINYWWGLSAGVVDFTCADEVPEPTLRLVRLLKEEMVAGRFRPFTGPLTDQTGRTVLGEGTLTAEEIVTMDYLVQNVAGSLPAWEALTPEARDLCRVQGLWKGERV